MRAKQWKQPKNFRNRRILDNVCSFIVILYCTYQVYVKMRVDIDILYTRWQSTIHSRNISLKNRIQYSTYLVDSCRYMTWFNWSWKVEELLIYKSLLAEKMLQSLLSWKYENIGMVTVISAVYLLTTLHWPKPYFRSRISTRVFSLVSSGENAGLSSGLCTGSVWDKRITIAMCHRS